MFSSENDELLNERDKQPTLPDTTVTETSLGENPFMILLIWANFSFNPWLTVYRVYEIIIIVNYSGLVLPAERKK